MPASLTFMASMPPTARTATTASTITIPILITNWNRSVTSTPQSPESVEIADVRAISPSTMIRSEEHTSELQSRLHLVCRLLLEKKKNNIQPTLLTKKKKMKNEK